MPPYSTFGTPLSCVLYHISVSYYLCLSYYQAVKRVISFRRTNSNTNLFIIGEKGQMWGQLTSLSEIAVLVRNPGPSIEGGDPLSVEPGESEE